MRACALSSASQQTQLKLRSAAVLRLAVSTAAHEWCVVPQLCTVGARARLCSSSCSRVASSSFWQKKKSMFAFKVANCNLDKQKLELRLLALKCAIKQNQEVIDIFCCYLVASYVPELPPFIWYWSVRDTSDYIYRLFCG